MNKQHDKSLRPVLVATASLNDADHANRRRVNYQLTTTSSNIKGSNNKNPICRQPILIGDTMFLPIPEPIAQQLHIDEHCWLEQIPTSEGIFLKILSKEIG